MGRLLIQMAKLRGATVFTTVGTAEKAEAVTALGADHVILYREAEFGAAVEAAAGPKPLDVVYDGVGKDVFDRSLELLKRRGMMVTFGNASGPVDPVLPLRLSQLGSLFLTRPTLGDYTATRAELERRSSPSPSVSPAATTDTTDTSTSSAPSPILPDNGEGGQVWLRPLLAVGLGLGGAAAAVAGLKLSRRLR